MQPNLDNLLQEQSIQQDICQPFPNSKTLTPENNITKKDILTCLLCKENNSQTISSLSHFAETHNIVTPFACSCCHFIYSGAHVCKEHPKINMATENLESYGVIGKFEKAKESQTPTLSQSEISEMLTILKTYYSTKKKQSVSTQKENAFPKPTVQEKPLDLSVPKVAKPVLQTINIGNQTNQSVPGIVVAQSAKKPTKSASRLEATVNRLKKKAVSGRQNTSSRSSSNMTMGIGARIATIHELTGALLFFASQPLTEKTKRELIAVIALLRHYCN